MVFLTANYVLRCCQEQQKNIQQVMLENEAKASGISQEEIIQQLKKSWQVMLASSQGPLENGEMHGKIIGGEAKKVWDFLQAGNSVSGPIMGKIMAYALSVSITNASMGRIVASPTAGSAGVLPAVFRTLQEERNLDEDTIVNGLLVAGAVGEIIAHSASISGAAGGCQAEIGSASAMTAAAVVIMLGGQPEQAFDAAAIALKNLLGLVCDPVAGLVECPCSKRNVVGAANAIMAAEMVLAGVHSEVPFDEVVGAMQQVGGLMPAVLKETAAGGLADTATGRSWKEKLEQQQKQTLK